MEETTTPTMIGGSTLLPAGPVSTVAGTTAESGSPSTATAAAPMPTGTADWIGNPARWEAMIRAGGVLEQSQERRAPRKLPSDRLYARPLNTIS
jgi:hypothetical protein